MSLEKTIQSNIFQKIKVLFLGKEKPNFLTQISVGLGFIIWIYLFSWYLLTLLSILLIDSLEHPEKIKATFSSVGNKYGYIDTMKLLMVHSLIEIFIYLIVLIGLILIWRKKKVGFLIFIFGNIGALLATIFVMGWTYFSREVPVVDLILIFCSVLYFGIGALIFYKWKSKEESNLNS